MGVAVAEVVSVVSTALKIPVWSNCKVMKSITAENTQLLHTGKVSLYIRPRAWLVWIYQNFKLKIDWLFGIIQTSQTEGSSSLLVFLID